MSRNYDHIKEYIEADLDEDVRLLISDFAILWNNYEHYLFSFNGEPNYSFYRLKKEDGVFSRRILNNINDETKENIDNYYNEILNYYKRRKNVVDINSKDIIDFFSIRITEITKKRGEFETVADFEKLFLSNKIVDKYIFILLVVGRVRNNMFHGIKELSSLNDQKELFEICNNILTMTLSITRTLVFV